MSFFVVLGFQDVAANCICEIPSLPIALDWFNLKTLHKLSSNERKMPAEPGFEPGAARREALPLGIAAPGFFTFVTFSVIKSYH